MQKNVLFRTYIVPFDKEIFPAEEICSEHKSIKPSCQIWAGAGFGIVIFWQKKKNRFLF